MTNEELIAKIKAEIERRKSLLTQHSKLTYDLILETFIKEYDALLSFLNTLEPEKPIDGIEGLEVASVELADMLLAKPKDYAISAKADYWNGAHDGVIAGAERQREQMMKGAVEGTVYPLDQEIWCNLDKFPELKDGGKVRIIVIPNTDEK